MSTAALHLRHLPLRFLTPPPPPATVTHREAKLHVHPSSLPLQPIHFKLSCKTQNRNLYIPQSLSSSPSPFSSSSSSSSSPKIRFNPSTRLFVSGLSFRTTEESLRNAFKNFGELLEVNLVMDKIANRPRGFAFLRYAKEEESKKAIEGMHGKFLDGRVIFVEIAKSRAEPRQESNQNAT